jgi:hypothetical protein
MEQAELTGGFHDLTSPQEQMVLDTIPPILESLHFRKSARYPALLEYLVRNTLDKNFDVLKERVIGMMVFGQPADYDTSNHPVVRIAAGEVRKRLELYFREHPDAPVRIELPAGSYRTEFYFRSPATEVTPSEELEPVVIQSHPQVFPAATSPESKQPGQGAKRNRRWLMLVALLLLVGGGVALWRYRNDREKQNLWWPVLHNDTPALIVIGGGSDPALAGKTSPGVNGQDETPMRMGNAIATIQICNVFREYSHDCKVMPAQSATFEDLRNKSVVLIGAFDNAWTQRLLAPLRYQFRFDDPLSSVQHRTKIIFDHDHPEAVSTWRVGPNSPSPEIDKEYAIVGRFRSEITDGMVVVAAGLGPAGTNSAGEYMSSPNILHEILTLAPKGWKGLNFEAVLQIEVVQGNAGHVKVVATQFW